MPRAFVSVGSNIDREHNIRSGLAALRRRFGRIQSSRVYETAPVGFDGDAFYNLVTAFDTTDPREAVAEELHAIERAHGRRRGLDRFTSRTLDLDLLLYGELVEGSLPRSEILQYAFVLRPLAELAPESRHPLSGKTFRELWETSGLAEELRAVDGRFED